ncbi:conserved exported hypothetical protein [Candidatus Sulfotelmatobacter sp. SbA7]|nr:conserved exported hypothetical protein [Candidatus Sulfotelmatobacter sp. SbA7]
MKSLRVRLLSVILLLAAMLYGGDWVYLRYRSWKRGDAFGSVTVTPVYVIHEKNGKTEYQYDPPQDQACVHSLFPHFGYSPCWYVSRHQEKRIDI